MEGKVFKIKILVIFLKLRVASLYAVENIIEEITNCDLNEFIRASMLETYTKMNYFFKKNKLSKIIKTLMKLSFYDKLIVSNLIFMLTIFDLG